MEMNRKQEKKKERKGIQKCEWQMKIKRRRER